MTLIIYRIFNNDWFIVSLNRTIVTHTHSRNRREDTKLSLRKRFDVQWDAKTQNDTLSWDYNRPNPLFWLFRATSPCLYICFCRARLLWVSCETSRLLTSPSSFEFISFPRCVFSTHAKNTLSVYAYAKSTNVYLRSSRAQRIHFTSGNTIIPVSREDCRCTRGFISGN